MTHLPPAAFMGYACGPAGIMVRVCAWHGADAKLEAETWAAPLPVTHSCCPQCAQRLMAEVTGEREIPATQDCACNVP